MRTLIILASGLFLGCSVLGQVTVTGNAKSQGPCSPAVTGSHNKLTITCQGVSNKLGSQLVELMNKIANNQLDAQAVMSKLDGCLAGVKSVREQQQPWGLTDDQKTKIRELLTGTKAKVSVHVIPTDRNASLMAIDILSVLNGIGWDTGAGMTSDFTLPPNLIGITFGVDHPNFPQAVALQQAFSAIGMKTGGFIDPERKKVPDGLTIFIAIGAKPEPVE